MQPKLKFSLPQRKLRSRIVFLCSNGTQAPGNDVGCCDGYKVRDQTDSEKNNLSVPQSFRPTAPHTTMFISGKKGISTSQNRFQLMPFYVNISVKFGKKHKIND